MTDGVQMNLNLGAIGALSEDRQRAVYEGLSRGFAMPAARSSDPSTAHEAAAKAKPGSQAMDAAILDAANAFRFMEAASAFAIASRVQTANPGRWDEGSIRTAVSRLGKRGLLVKDGKGKSPRGQACDLWRLP